MKIFREIDDFSAIEGYTLLQSAKLLYLAETLPKDINVGTLDFYGFIDELEAGEINRVTYDESIEEIKANPEMFGNPEKAIADAEASYAKWCIICDHYNKLRGLDVDTIADMLEKVRTPKVAKPIQKPVVKPTPKPVEKPQAKITRYAIIDHVGTLTTTENKRIYKRVYTQAKADELSAYTLKKVCMADSPYAREVTSKMKYRARYQKNPTKVYLICDTLDSTAESVMQIWESRNIPVEVFEVNGFMETHQLDFGETPDRKRRIAEVWAPAIGWSFSAPVTRIQREVIADNFCKRPDHDEMVARGETHFTKPFTSSEMFLEMNRCIAPDSEIEAFYQHVMYLWNTVIDGHRLIESSLEPDYIICKECGKPMKIHTGDCECPHCQTRFSEDIVLTTYYEDSSNFDE